jgi:hypothetical protein
MERSRKVRARGWFANLGDTCLLSGPASDATDGQGAQQQGDP